MTPDQMRQRSSDKVKQVTEMMKILNLRVEARQRVSEQGFLEQIVFWIDEEQYKPADAVGETGSKDAGGSPVGPTGESHV